MSTVDMPPSSSSWRYISTASAKFSSLRGLVHHSVSSVNVGGSPSRAAANAVGTTDDQRQSWRAWAAQKIRGRLRSPQGDSNNEVLTLFPGWAARRYATNEGFSGGGGEPLQFEVEAFVSGYAFTRRSTGQATRSQRAFIRLAKGFAALPRMTDQQSPVEDLSSEKLLNQVTVPPASDDFRLLDQHFRSLGSHHSESESEPDFDPSLVLSQQNSLPSPTLPPKQLDTPTDVLQKLHFNLESRLQLFWSSTLPARTVRLHLFALPHNNRSHHDSNEFEHEPLASQDVTTAGDGSFTARFRVRWDDLCQHPSGCHIALSEKLAEHDLVIVAELLPPSVTTSSEMNTFASTPTSTSPDITSSSQPHAPSPHNHHTHSHTRSRHHHHPHLHNILTSFPSTLPSLSSLPSLPYLTRFLTPASTCTRTTVPITHSPIRVISDIDDTIKHSGVPEGSRAVFQNVFVKELKDGVIPGMGDWYTDMWNKGARFHYVSNGPYEYISVLDEFFGIANLPPGSIKLRSYAGKSFLSGLLSAPAARKRAGVTEVLESFPDSKFLLIGDSGEQDMELYAELAKEKPQQILAVLIRDAEESSYTPIDDPTGWNAIAAGSRSQTFDANTGVFITTSSPTLTSAGNESATPRFRNAKRAFSDTFASVRASVSGRSPIGRVREEPPEDDTPRQQQFPSFTISSPTSDTPLSSSPSSVSSLSTTSPASSPMISTPTSEHITTPPAPVPPLSVPCSTSYFSGAAGPQRSATDSLTPSQPRNLLPQRHASASASYKSRLTIPSPSSRDDAAPTSAAYYKPETPSRYGSFAGLSGEGWRRSSATGGAGMGNIAEGGSSASSGSSGNLVGGAPGSGRLSESEKKRQDLQTRVYRARTQMPSSVKLRVFRNPSECAEEVDPLLVVGDR